MKKLFVPFCLLLAACAAPQTQPHVTSATVPEIKQHLFIASDGARLPYRQWLPKGKPKAVIIALHGFNDYSHAFEIPGKYMRARGVAVIAYDQRGFGSAPSRGVWAGEDNLVRDADDMVAAMHTRYPHVPIYLLGESMGGAVAVIALARSGYLPVDGLILSAPALWGGETMNPFFRLMLWAGVHTVPNTTLTGEDLHILASDNIDMLRALGYDPLVIKATRLDAVYGLVQIMDDGYSHISKVRVPMLLLYGAHDQVIPPEPMRSAMRRAPEGTKIAYYPLGYHMLLRDLHGDVPVRDILAWIRNKDAPLPSGYEAEAMKFLK